MSGLNITQLVMLIIVIISFSLIIYFVVKSLKQKCDIDYTYDKKLKRCKPVCKDDLPFYNSQKNICLECPENISESKVACDLFAKLSGKWREISNKLSGLNFEQDIKVGSFNVEYLFITPDKTTMKMDKSLDFNNWINNKQNIIIPPQGGIKQYLELEYKEYLDNNLHLNYYIYNDKKDKVDKSPSLVVYSKV